MTFQMTGVQSRPVTDRLFSFECARLLAAIAVISIHIGGSRTMGALGETARFAVPLFFGLSGYFFAYRRPFPLERRVMRLLQLYLFWVLAYAGLHLLIGRGPTDDLPIRLVFGGGHGFHLWFISGLCQVTILFWLMRRWSWPAIFALSVLLFLLNLAFGVYGTAFGAGLDWNPRYGPFFGLVFFAYGAWIADRGVVPRRPFAWLALTAGLAAANNLELVLMKWLGIPEGFDYGIPDVRLLTLPLGLAAITTVAAFKDHSPDWPVAREVIGRLATVSLGIYACHILVLHLIRHDGGLDSEPVAVFAATVTGSTLLALALSATPLRRFVT